jgi:hypothetical protein
MTTILKVVVATALVSLTGNASVEAAGRERMQEPVEQSPSGLITGLKGAVLLGTAGGSTRTLSLGDRVTVAEELRTGPDDILEVLWDRHTFILIRPQSTVLIHESRAGQTEVSLRTGSVRVALAYGGRPTDMVTVQTPSSRVFTRGGIVEVDVLPPPPSLFSQVASVFSKTESPVVGARLENVRVLEGESGIEPLTSNGQSEMLEAGVQARIAGGLVQQVTELPRNAAKGIGLADTDRRQGTPAPLAKLIANVHVNHALEVERQLSAQAPALDRTGPTATGPEVKGAIVSTSLGVPTIQLTQPGTTIGPVTSNPLPGPTSGPVTSTPPPSAVSPLPTLPPVQAPTITTLAPSQSGGINSRNLLNDVLNDDDKGRGKHNGRGNDRDD